MELSLELGTVDRTVTDAIEQLPAGEELILTKKRSTGGRGQ